MVLNRILRRKTPVDTVSGGGKGIANSEPLLDRIRAIKNVLGKKSTDSDTPLEKEIEQFVWKAFVKSVGEPMETLVQRVLDEVFGKKMGNKLGKNLEYSAHVVLEEILEKILGRVLARQLEGIMEGLVEQALGKVLTSALEKSLEKTLDAALERSLGKVWEKSVRDILQARIENVPARKACPTQFKQFLGTFWRRKPNFLFIKAAAPKKLASANTSASP